MAMTITEKIPVAARAGTKDVGRGERVDRTPGLRVS
jgi:hypothetical protein